jgi:hypothetical protein
MTLRLKQQESLTAPRSNLWTQRKFDFAAFEHNYGEMVKMRYHFMMNEDEMRRMVRGFLVRKKAMSNERSIASNITTLLADTSFHLPS